MVRFPSGVPSYQALLQRTDAPAGSAWGVFGANDERGTVNFLGPEQVRRAVGLVRDGTTFNLDLPINAFEPSLFGRRGRTEHVIEGQGTNTRDDRLDNFYLQSTTQLDGLRHVLHWEHGSYNGVDVARIDAGEPVLGIQEWSRTGIVGRSVLVDLPRYFASVGRTEDPFTAYGITVADLQAAAAFQSLKFEPADVLLIRTGWMGKALAAPIEERLRWHSRFSQIGLDQSHEMVEWLWDSRFSVVACDNATVERFPPRRDSPFVSQDEAARIGRTMMTGMIHRVMIPLLGMALGELWALDELATACAADGRYEFLLIAKPLNIPGGVGSPANALAIR
jgi:kynurenine formamidase